MSDYENRYRTAQKAVTNALKPTHELQKIIHDSLEPYRTIQNLIAEMMLPYQKLSKFCTSPFSSALEKFSHSIYEEISSSIDKISFDDSTSTEDMKKTIQHMAGSYLNRKILGSPSERPFQFLEDLGGLPEDDDFVIIEEPAIRDWEIPDEATLRIGHNRLKMKTSDLINIIIFLLNFVLSILINVEPSHQSPTEFEKKQYQIEIIQTQLLYDLLHNADVSSSSQADFLQSLIENVEVQKAELPDLEEYLDSIQQSIDNRNESENTESEN